jgi:prepilin-type N-terminal cleavage/methylation domain-containing protein
MKRTGFTLIELLIVISIITLLVSLALPAVQAARESSRRSACQNKLRQIGLGIQEFEAAYLQYPPDGWGWGWVGDCRLGGTKSRFDGPGGWIHHLLPFVEQQSLWDLTASREGRNQAMQEPLDLFVCPSRRDAVASPYTQTSLPLRNADLPAIGSRTDYAICAGDQVISVGPGPEDVAGLKSFPVPAKNAYSGISFVRSTISSRDVTDGTSHTLAVAEKLVIPLHYTSGESLGDDQTILIGDDADIRR